MRCMQFVIVESGDPLWSSVFKRLPDVERDIFYSPAYAQLSQTTLNCKHKVRAAVFLTGTGGALLYPFVMRHLSNVIDNSLTSELCDTISLYGRGGVVGVANDAELKLFYSHLRDYFLANNVICSFNRLHPVIANQSLAHPTELIIKVGEYVVVDLTRDMPTIIQGFKPSVRKDIRKAERNGISCIFSNNLALLDSFMSVYNHTMDRTSAQDFYYFNKNFYDKLVDYLPNNFHFFYAQQDDKVISCELVLHHGDYAHSFIGGTQKDKLTLGANSLLKLKIIETMKDKGCKYFMLGGGHAPDDGIIKYKKAFAMNGALESYVGGMSWQPDKLAELKNNMKAAGSPISEYRYQFYDLR
jgi:hypothetical protein